MNWLRLTVLTAAFVGLSAPAAAFCGKESEPPCPDWHRAEPCDPGLTDEDNVCVPGGPAEEEPAPPEHTPEDPPGAEAPPPTPSPEATLVGYPPVGPDQTYAHVSKFPEGEATALDGVWRADFNKALFRLDRGRLFAVTPYLQLLVFQVEAGDVVVRDVYRAAPGLLTGYDVIAPGPWSAKLNAEGALEVEVGTLVGPFRTVMRPVAMDDPAAAAAEVESLSR